MRCSWPTSAFGYFWGGLVSCYLRPLRPAGNKGYQPIADLRPKVLQCFFPSQHSNNFAPRGDKFKCTHILHTLTTTLSTQKKKHSCTHTNNPDGFKAGTQIPVLLEVSHPFRMSSWDIIFCNPGTLRWPVSTYGISEMLRTHTHTPPHTQNHHIITYLNRLLRDASYIRQ